MLNDLLLLLLAAGTYYTDLRWRKIPNLLTVPTIICGLILAYYSGGIPALSEAGKGIVLGLLVLFIPFSRGGLGAGDIKFLAAVGALKGPSFLAVSLLVGAVIGGLMSVIELVRHRALATTAQQMAIMMRPTGNSMITIPYGVALSLGVVLSWALTPWLL